VGLRQVRALPDHGQQAAQTFDVSQLLDAPPDSRRARWARPAAFSASAHGPVKVRRG